MGFFDIFRKNRMEEEILSLDGMEERLKESGRKKKKKKKAQVQKKEISPEERREYLIMDRCEEILEMLERVEQSRKEYQVVTDQLLDMELMEALGEHDKREIIETARAVTDAEIKRDEAMKKESKISKEQFRMIQEKEDQIFDSLKKLEENETYQKAVKRDMNTLEGEKSVWMREREDLHSEKERYRVLPIICLVVYAVLMITLVFVSFSFEVNMTMGYLLVSFAAALLVAWLVYQMSTFHRRQKQVEKNLNYTIDLLNKAKFKYVHVTAAVDYAYEKYQVNSSHELLYLWEQYQETVRDKERYRQAKTDLEHYSFQLVKILSSYQFRQPEIWISELEVLVNKDRMEEKKKSINQRRSKLRSIIDYSMEMIRNSREDIARMAVSGGGMEEELLGVLKAIDRICGSF